MDIDAKEALYILGRARPGGGWVDLYKVFEIIRHNIRPDDFVSRRWVARADLNTFTPSANRPDVSGLSARHARLPGGPPTRTMTLPEAQLLIARLSRDLARHCILIMPEFTSAIGPAHRARTRSSNSYVHDTESFRAR